VYGVAQRVLAEAGEEMFLVCGEGPGLQARLEPVRDVRRAAEDVVRAEARQLLVPRIGEERFLQRSLRIDAQIHAGDRC
jgi:hypothetical protein